MGENATAATAERRPERRFAGALPWEPERDPAPLATAAPIVLPERARPKPAPTAAELEDLGRRTAEVAHDFNNLLSVIMVCASEIAAGGGEQAERAEEIRAAAERGAALSRGLTTGHREGNEAAPAVEPVAVPAAIAAAEALLARTLGNRVALAVDCAAALPAVGIAAAELERILLNLAANARDAMPEGGSVAIAAGTVTIPPGDPVLGTGLHVRIAFADSGSGMSAETARRALEPYYSTKQAGAGSGLGLAGARALVRDAGGELRINTRPGGGTTISIYLPALSPGGEPLALPGAAG